MKNLNHLGHLAEEVREKGGLTAQWVTLNAYFRGDDPMGQIERWAKSEALHVSFDYEEKSPTYAKVRSVTFFPIRPAT